MALLIIFNERYVGLLNYSPNDTYYIEISLYFVVFIAKKSFVSKVPYANVAGKFQPAPFLLGAYILI